jgi:hypothetical protein
MRCTTLALTLFAVAGSARTAAAGDALKLVCSALVRPTDGGSQLGVFVHFIEHRASDGASRDEHVSTIYQGTLFTAKTRNKSGAPANQTPVAMTAGKRTVYRGTYSLVQDHKAGTWMMHLAGSFDENPTGKPVKRPIDVDLPCVDISN